MSHSRTTSWCTFATVLLTTFAVFTPSYAIKFELPSALHPVPKCVWNAAHKNALVIVTANVGPGRAQRVDVEIMDREGDKNVYLSKKDIKGETRLAITAHQEGEVGVCFKNYLDPGQYNFGRSILPISI